jgi:type II secretory ATPase GspE/PulE/Tfp pilus assembly ATPase PilB-like protein
MLEFVPTHALGRLLWISGWWLVLVASWVAACVWIDEDARRVFGNPMPWSPLFVTAGAFLQLVTFQYGLAGSWIFWIFALLFVIGGGAYLRRRDTKVPPPERILTGRTVAKMLLAVATRLRMEAAFRKWFAPIAEFADDAPAREIVVFLKKDGRDTAVGHEGEISLALQDAEKVFATAIRRRATDIQLEPKADGSTHVRCRIDGMMQSDTVLFGKSGPAVISALKVVADMNIAERRRPQDGTFRVLVAGQSLEVRVATAPTSYGEKMALRLLDSEGGVVKQGLDGIGVEPAVIQSLRSIIHQPHGMLLVCGPTGSGKTTTAYAAISEIDALTRNIVTIEDPIECRLPNISQTGVNSAANLTFADILRSLLRQDPDVILVGEIRDRETAEIAMQAALTGHFVFSTLHANDAATTVARLLKLGVDVTLIQTALSAVLAQRLIRILCEQCKQPYPAPAEWRQRIPLPSNDDLTIYRPNSCHACGGTGYRGRTAVSELLVLDNRIRELLVARPSWDTILATARQTGMRTIRESADALVIRGITSIEEVDRITK